MRAAVKPIFCIVLGDGERWIIEAEWPDGTIERVDDFEANYEAVNWINQEADSWLKDRGI
jgi:hypothetical protein